LVHHGHDGGPQTSLAVFHDVSHALRPDLTGGVSRTLLKTLRDSTFQRGLESCETFGGRQRFSSCIGGVVLGRWPVALIIVNLCAGAASGSLRGPGVTRRDSPIVSPIIAGDSLHLCGRRAALRSPVELGSLGRALLRRRRVDSSRNLSLIPARGVALRFYVSRARRGGGGHRDGATWLRHGTRKHSYNNHFACCLIPG